MVKLTCALLRSLGVSTNVTKDFQAATQESHMRHWNGSYTSTKGFSDRLIEVFFYPHDVLFKNPYSVGCSFFKDNNEARLVNST